MRNRSSNGWKSQEALNASVLSNAKHVQIGLYNRNEQTENNREV
jgi:hypothetical protein